MIEPKYKGGDIDSPGIEINKGQNGNQPGGKTDSPTTKPEQDDWKTKWKKMF